MADPTPTDTRTIKRLAHAKVNLALAVDLDHDSQLHPIASWMAPLDLADELTITALPEDRLSRYAIRWHTDAPQPCVPIDWSVTRDLAVRAHLLVQHHIGRQLPIQLKLEKKIPVGGGLGGGSSDAATMLLALRSLFELDLTDQRLGAIAAELGSDVAFFLHDSILEPALVEGAGDRIVRTPRVDAALVLIFPEFGCPTGRVYAAFDELVEAAAADGETWTFRDEHVRRLAQDARIRHDDLFNDLAAPAERVEPRLAMVRSTVERAIGVTPHVTGSGSSLFIICPGGTVEAELLAQQLDRLLVGCAVIAARIR